MRSLGTRRRAGGVAFAPLYQRVSAARLILLAVSLLAVGGLLALVAACGKSERPGLGPRVIPFGQPVPKGGGHYKVGSAYTINGRTYQPREYQSYDRVGTASWYGELFHGRHTANGEIYDMERLSAAHPTLPLPAYARVTNLETGRSLVVRVNDRGPYAHDRLIDLSKRSAELLGFANKGTARVRVTYLGKAPLNGDDSYERRYAAQQPWIRGSRYALTGDRRADQMPVGSIEGRTANAAPPLPEAKPEKAAASARVANAAAPSPERQRGATQAPSLLAPATVAEAGTFSIQAGSFRSEENAENARLALQSIAPVEVKPVEAGGETYFRVRAGPFPEMSQAKRALQLVTAAGFPGAKIVSH